MDILEILERNPSWHKYYLYAGGSFCNTGWLLHELCGIDKVTLCGRGTSIDVDDRVKDVKDVLQECLGLEPKVVRDLMEINDGVDDFGHNVRALRFYFDKSVGPYVAIDATRESE